MFEKFISYAVPIGMSIFVLLAPHHARAAGDPSPTCQAYSDQTGLEVFNFVPWLEGYLAGRKDAERIDLERSRVDEFTKRLGDYCKDHPKETILQAARVAYDAKTEQKVKGPAQVCQGQARTSLVKINVSEGSFRIFMRGNRCLMFLQAPAIFEGKRSISLIEVTGRSGNIPAGDLLSEFYGPKDSERGLCSFRGGKFKTNADCTLTDYFEKSDQM